jgi:hypothetical protein
MKWEKWIYAVIAGFAAGVLWYYLLQLLGFKDDRSINYFKDLYNYTVVVALLSGREVFRYFRKRERKRL